MSPTPPGSEDPATLQGLEQALLSLPGIHPTDAKRIATTALDATADLHARYRPQRPPQLGNLSVQLGLRDRGLCCHWAEDLLRALSQLELESVSLQWGVAHHGNVLREHSTVVVVPHGAAFRDGLVLDGWRNAGHLYFARVERDRYPWKRHPSDAAGRRIVCRNGDD